MPIWLSILVNSLNDLGLKYEKVSYAGQRISSYTKYDYLNKPDATALENMSVSL